MCAKDSTMPIIGDFDIIDVACNNAFIHLKRDGYPKAIKMFLSDLSSQSATDFLKRRCQTDRVFRFQKPILQAAEVFGCLQEVDNPSFAASGRCHVCSKVSRSLCDRCYLLLCPLHRIMKRTCLRASCVKS